MPLFSTLPTIEPSPFLVCCYCEQLLLSLTGEESRSPTNYALFERISASFRSIMPQPTSDAIAKPRDRAAGSDQLQPLRQRRSQDGQELQGAVHRPEWLRLQGLQLPPYHPGVHAPGW